MTDASDKGARANRGGASASEWGETAPNAPVVVRRRCIDETAAPCYWRGTDWRGSAVCTRGPADGPCAHADEIAARWAKADADAKAEKGGER